MQNSTNEMVYLSIPEAFLDASDEPWTIRRGNRIQQLKLGDVIMHTLRAIPVATANDSIRAHDIFMLCKHSNGSVAFEPDDFTWMIEHFRANAHAVWNPVDAVFLVQYLETSVTHRTPSLYEVSNGNNNTPDGTT